MIQFDDIHETILCALFGITFESLGCYESIDSGYGRDEYYRCEIKKILYLYYEKEI